MRKSQFLALVAVFAALNVVFDSLMGLPELSSGVWYSWIFIVEPINGIVLGPYAGFLSSLIGVMIGHSIYFRDVYEFLFTLGAPIGAMITGFLFRGKWKMVLTYYTALLGIYFITPIAWQLPVWGMWDVYFAYVILLVVAVMMARKGSWNPKSKGLLYVIALSAFIGLEADILFRIFVLIPCQTYRLFYGWDAKTLIPIWVLGAAETPLRVAISILVTTIVGPPLIKVVSKLNLRHLLLEDVWTWVKMSEKTKIRLYLLFFCVVTFSLSIISLKDAYTIGFIVFYCLFAYCFLVLLWEETKG
jgi:hypothetical protein